MNKDKRIYNIYNKYKNILSGCRTIHDALYFAQDIIKENPDVKELINSMIHGKQYERVLDLRSISQILNILNEFKSRNEIDSYINENLKNNIDIVQLNSLMRVGESKQNIVNEITNKVFRINNEITSSIEKSIE